MVTTSYYVPTVSTVINSFGTSSSTAEVKLFFLRRELLRRLYLLCNKCRVLSLFVTLIMAEVQQRRSARLAAVKADDESRLYSDSTTSQSSSRVERQKNQTTGSRKMIRNRNNPQDTGKKILRLGKRSLSKLLDMPLDILFEVNFVSIHPSAGCNSIFGRYSAICIRWMFST